MYTKKHVHTRTGGLTSTYQHIYIYICKHRHTHAIIIIYYCINSINTITLYILIYSRIRSCIAYLIRKRVAPYFDDEEEEELSCQISFQIFVFGSPIRLFTKDRSSLSKQRGRGKGEPYSSVLLYLFVTRYEQCTGEGVEGPEEKAGEFARSR